jgi:hypothetical protein
MLLTIRTTPRPATDLGFALHSIRSFAACLDSSRALLPLRTQQLALELEGQLAALSEVVQHLLERVLSWVKAIQSRLRFEEGG